MIIPRSNIFVNTLFEKYLKKFIIDISDVQCYDKIKHTVKGAVIMSVDVGESLMQSWLRHVKRCDIVQTNWKAAIHLGINKDKADRLLDDIRIEFPDFAKGQSSSQIIRQLEIDALGCVIDKKKYFACDVAFHTSGLHYKKGDDAVPSKMLRTVLCLYSFIEASEAVVVFATPKFVSDTDKKNLQDFVDTLNDCLKNKWGLGNYSVRLYSDYGFETCILNPIIHLTKDIQDTSEVFVRTLQLVSVTRGPIITNGAAPASETDCITSPSGLIDVSELKAQDLIEQYVLPILSETSSKKLKPFFDKDESKKMFGCNYPFFSTAKITQSGKSRCYANTYYLNKIKQNVYVTNDCNRQKLIEWINNNIAKTKL